MKTIFPINMKVKVSFVIFLLIFLFLSVISFSENNVDEKIDNQNKIIEESLNDKIKTITTEDEDLNLGKYFDRPDDEDSIKIDKDKVPEFTIRIFLKLRKFAIPTYLLLIAINIFLMATSGSKNLSNRRHYFFAIISAMITFLVMLNIPFIIMFILKMNQSDMLKINTFSSKLFNILYLLKNKSWIMSGTILIYGIIFKCINKGDASKIKTSKFLINMSILIFITLQTLPTLASLLM